MIVRDLGTESECSCASTVSSFPVDTSCDNLSIRREFLIAVSGIVDIRD